MRQQKSLNTSARWSELLSDHPVQQRPEAEEHLKQKQTLCLRRSVDSDLYKHGILIKLLGNKLYKTQCIMLIFELYHFGKKDFVPT